MPQTISHTLPLKLSEPFIEIDGNLMHRHGDSYSKYSYTIHLKPNTLYDYTTIQSPELSEDAATIILGPEDTVFLKLLDSMVFSFSHWLQAGEQVALLEEEVEVSAIVEIPGKWSKEIELVPATEIKGLAEVSFPVDLTELTGILDTVQRETGVSSSTRNLTISAKVSTLAQTDFGIIDDEYTHSLVTDLTGGILDWNGELENTEPRSIETSEIIERKEKYLGIPVIIARILLSSLSGIILILFGFSLVMYYRTRSERPEDAGRLTEKMLNKYRGIIVDTRTMPLAVPTDTVVQLESLDDLIKIAQGLLKPVLHKEEQGKHIYCVLDNTTRYEYVIGWEVRG